MPHVSSQTQPSISIVIPTLNSAKTLDDCLKAIKTQDYQSTLIEILICDGGSIDGTLEIAKKHNTVILHNKLKTGEAGKAVGVKKARHELIALIDSDNILPHKKWLTNMVAPLQDSDLIGSEPIEFTYVKTDTSINRYCALMGMNDPLCYFLGNFDKWNLLTQSWSRLKINTIDHATYLELLLTPNAIPTIGANGTIFRSTILKSHCTDYLFDIDIICKEIDKNGMVKFAKVKDGILHLFCKNLSDFYKKQKRRIYDFHCHHKKGTREYPWNQIPRTKIAIFVLSCITILPLIFQSIKGYKRKPDKAWFLHPILCWITLIVYAMGTLNSLFNTKELSRSNWQQ